MGNEKYLEAYLDESGELLEKLDAKLVELEESGGGVDELFRIFHTLKGSSASMGFEDVATLSHRLEDVLGRVREGELKVSPELVDFLLEGSDGLRAMIDAETGGGAQDNRGAALIEKARKYLGEQGAGVKAAMKLDLGLTVAEEGKLKKLKEPLWKLSLKISAESAFKGARALLLLRELGKIATIHKQQPQTVVFHNDDYDGSMLLLFSSKLSEKELEAKLKEQVLLEVESYTLEPYHFEEKQVHNNNHRRGNGSIRVEAAKIDELLNLAGELVIGQAQLDRKVEQLNDDELKQLAANSDRLILDLQAAVMKVRMVPLDSVFGRFPRLIRDLSRELGKEVNFRLEGTETEVDRTVAEGLVDPLMHLLRNAIDHGIEKPQLRKAQGKEEKGEIVLAAAQEGESVLITVQDDGKGIDPQSVRESALEKNLVTPERLAEMTDHEVLNLVFFPGLSTVKDVTDVSGRGVGMDVVRSTIESLGGVVSVESIPGEGTRTTIRLPLTLAIVRALLVQVGEEIYAIPLSQIVELVNLSNTQTQNVRGQECLYYNEKVVSLFDLGALLEVPGYSPRAPRVVLIDCGQQYIGCRVDQYLGQENIVVKAVGGYLPQLPYLGGATILGDGKVVLILDGRNLVA